MNRFIMANSQQCLGCHACEIACVMAHNDEQHVLSQHHFHPRITVIKHQQQRSAVTCHHCEDAPCARSCPNGLSFWYDANRPDTRRGRKSKSHGA